MSKEDYFPRGKVPGAGAGVEGEGSSGQRKGSSDVNLFKNVEEKSEEKRKKKKKKSKNDLTPEEKKALKGDENYEDEKRFGVVPLSYEQLVEGSLTLGIITKIKKHEIVVNMPGRTSGSVSIADISAPYIAVLERHLGGEKLDDGCVLYTLREMFQIGQCVIVKVKTSRTVEGRTQLSLSMNPKDLYANYSTTVLQENLIMVAAVASVEDHGYQMDIGINGARSFLSKEDVRRHVLKFDQKYLGIGQLVACKITKVKCHRFMADVKLTSYPKGVCTQQMDEISGLNYSLLMPGMLIDVVAMETHKTGIMVYCLGLDGLINQDHMTDDWTTPESIEIGESLPARILYVLPSLTMPYLTLQSNLAPMSIHRERMDRSRMVGTKRNVQVVTVTKRGLTVRFEDSSKGIIPINHLGNQSLLSVEDIAKHYKEGSTHECRVIHQSPMDKMYLCSLRKDKLENDFAHAEMVQPGDKVTCKILRWNNGGAIIEFGSNIRAFMPNQLYRLEQLSDNAKDKLVGTMHKARVISKNTNTDRIIVSARKELINSEGAVIADLSDAEPGLIGHCVIKNCTNNAAFVETIGGMEGFIPMSKLFKIYGRGDDAREALGHGQILKYEVVEANADRNQLIMKPAFGSDDNEENKQPRKEENKQPRKEAKKRRRSESEGEERYERSSTKERRDQREKSKYAKKERKEYEKHERNEAKPKMDTTLGLPEAKGFWMNKSLPLNEVIKDGEASDEEPVRTVKSVVVKVTKKAKKETKAHSGGRGADADITDLAVNFENGIIPTPDDPTFWIKLMTHYASVANIEKARGVAKKALKTINYRDEDAQLKIWKALFNLEVLYGTGDTIRATFCEALKRTDEFECLKIMALVYDRSGFVKEAEGVYREMVKKFRLEVDAWIRFGTMYFTNNQGDAGRALLSEALNAVEAQNQIHLITKFALLEFHHGEMNRGESMLDKILGEHPHRCDLWLLYANALIKLKEYDRARAVFKKAFEVKWNPYKVKPLLKRFQEFETEHGTKETLGGFQLIALQVLNVSDS